MTSVSGGGNYISDGAIMAWLEQQQDRLYGDLRDSMHSSEARAEFADDLNDIKAALHRANDSANHDFVQVGRDMQAFLAKYASDPLFQELCEGLEKMMQQVCQDTQAHVDYPAKLAAYNRALVDFVSQGGNPDGPDVQPKMAKGVAVFNQYITKPKAPDVPPEQKYNDDTLKTWDELIGGKLDVVSKNDQITMIHIQQLKASIDQGSQFGSQYIASGDKTSNSIINNIA